MNRRQVLNTVCVATAGACLSRPGRPLAEDAGENVRAAEGGMIYLNPATGSDSNSGAKDSPLRTLAAAIMFFGALSKYLDGLYDVAGRRFRRIGRVSFQLSNSLFKHCVFLFNLPDTFKKQCNLSCKFFDDSVFVHETFIGPKTEFYFNYLKRP